MKASLQTKQVSVTPFISDEFDDVEVGIETVVCGQI